MGSHYKSWGRGFLCKVIGLLWRQSDVEVLESNAGYDWAKPKFQGTKVTW